MKTILLTVALCTGAVMAQQTTGTLKGKVVDELGGAIVGAAIVVSDGNGTEKTVTVSPDSQTLSTEPENNLGAIVLKGADLDALPSTVLAADACRRSFRFAKFASRLGISKTFGFGGETSRTTAGDNGRRGGDAAGPRGAIGRGGVGVAGARGGGGGGGRGGFGGGSGGDTGKRYNLTFAINIQNPLNRANLGKPNGNLSSPFFGMSTASTGNFGGFGSAPGSSAYNRRIDAQIRFSF